MLLTALFCRGGTLTGSFRKASIRFIATACMARCWCSHVSLLARPPLSLTHSLVQYRCYGKKKSHRVELTSEEASAVDLDQLKEEMTAVLTTLKWEYNNVINARITPGMVGNVSVQVGNKQTPLRELAQISLPNAQNIVLKFHNTSCITAAAKELQVKLHVNPVVNDSIVKIPIPRPSKELRDKLCQDAKASSDKAKVTLRRVRQSAITQVQKSKISKDSLERAKAAIHALSVEFVGSIDSLLKAKTESLSKA